MKENLDNNNNKEMLKRKKSNVNSLGESNFQNKK